MADRRPIPVRTSRPAVRAARWLAEVGVHPNGISIASVAFAALGAGALIASRDQDGAARYALLLAAAVCMPLRLLCNMLDGMVAVEFGKRSKSGEIYNELPDRISDVLLLAGAGYAISEFDWAAALGWAAAVLAVLTAYVRTMMAANGVAQDYSGPMAKQQRMAVLAAACIAAIVEDALGGRDYALTGALILIIAGSALTAARRTYRLSHELESR
jgi:phosphatidylglycerophosphate synthase